MGTPEPQLKTILIIEDDHDTRVSLRQSLEREGYFVFSAPNGQQAIEILKRIKPPCLILLDAIMPIMNGAEFLQAIELDLIMHVVPVIMVSAYPEIAKTLIVKEFIQKPIHLDKLLAVIEKHCPHPA